MTQSQSIYLVLLETSGNQQYVFATNKLKEVVGASEALYRAGTAAVVEALKISELRAVDLGQLGAQPKIEADEAVSVEVIAATSGKCLMLVRGQALAQRIAAEWSTLLLAQYPGVDASGAISRLPVDFAAELGLKLADDAKALSLAQAVQDVHVAHELTRTLRRSPLARFAQSPVVAVCRHSGLPAAIELSEAEGKSETGFEASWVVAGKRALTDAALQRFGTMLPKHEQFVRNLGALERMTDGDWLAVVHADGNGLGSLFLNLPDAIAKTKGQAAQALGLGGNVAPGRLFVECYRSLSNGVEAVTRQALDAALDRVEVKWRSSGRASLAFLPVVLGGDDLTAVMSGRHALLFTVAYQEEFLRISASKEVGGVLPALTRAFQGAPGLGIAAGLAIVKPHFPFSAAYELAGELCDSAKRIKKYERHGDQPQPAAALDFHLLYDSTLPGLEAIRERLVTPDRFCVLTAKPFVVAVSGKRESEWSDWSKSHAWSKFEGAAHALSAKRGNTEQLLLPRSQSHALRQILFTGGKAAIAANWLRLTHLYPDFAQQWPERTSAGSAKLTSKRPLAAADQPALSTVFLDALDAATFWPEAGAALTPSASRAAGPQQQG
jgi:hypothetical protein